MSAVCRIQLAATYIRLPEDVLMKSFKTDVSIYLPKKEREAYPECSEETQ